MEASRQPSTPEQQCNMPDAAQVGAAATRGIVEKRFAAPSFRTVPATHGEAKDTTSWWALMGEDPKDMSVFAPQPSYMLEAQQ